MSNATREQRRVVYERMVGSTIGGKYRITGLLGFGGMGAVYEAVQSAMERKVALKLIPTYDPTAAARFEREAFTVSKLSHPNTVTVFDFGQTDENYLYLAMEHLTGRTLTDLIRAESPLPAARVVHIAQQICRSLGEAHRQGIIHRDVKPDNIFLIEVDGDPDYVKVLDFGIAKAVHGEEDVNLTAEGRIIGTPRYMSPEQILALPVDHRSDLYSLGCILFEMACGTPPFDQQSMAALMMSHAQQTPPTFAERLTEEQLNLIPAGLETVARRAMAKKAASRPQTTDQLCQELGQALRINQAYEATNTRDQYAPPSTVNYTGPRPSPDPNRQTGGFDRHTGDFSRQTGDFATQQERQQVEDEASQRDMELAGVKTGPSRPLVATALVLFLLAIGGGVYVALSSESTATTTTTTNTNTTPTISPDDASNQGPVTETRLVSSPPGAKVFKGEELLGTTPLTLPVDPDAPPTIYRFELDGHAPQAIEVDFAHPQRSYVTALQRATAPSAEDDAKERDAGKKNTRSKPARDRKPSRDEPPAPKDDGEEDASPGDGVDASKDPVEKDPAPEEKDTTPKIEMIDDEEETTKPNVGIID